MIPFKKILAFILFIYFHFSIADAQSCLPDGISISDNYASTEFIAEHPDCTEIEGDVTIYSDLVGDLSGFQNITSIGGNLIITGTGAYVLSHFSSLESIGGHLTITDAWDGIGSGLNNLRTIGGDLRCLGNMGFTDLSALDSVETVGGSLVINDNAGSGSFSSIGMTSLKSIGGVLQITDGFSYDPNIFLGMNNLTNIGGLVLNQTNGITHFDDLISLMSISGEITIEWTNLQSLNGLKNADLSNLNLLKMQFNTSLTECSLANICVYIMEGGETQIANEGMECTTVTDFLTDCDEILNLPQLDEYTLKLSPNPVQDILHIEYLDNHNYEILIYDMNGIVISQYSNAKIIDTSLLNSGVYFIQILDTNSNHRKIERIVKL